MLLSRGRVNYNACKEHFKWPHPERKIHPQCMDQDRIRHRVAMQSISPRRGHRPQGGNNNQECSDARQAGVCAPAQLQKGRSAFLELAHGDPNPRGGWQGLQICWCPGTAHITPVSMVQLLRSLCHSGQLTKSARDRIYYSRSGIMGTIWHQACCAIPDQAQYV